MVWYPLDEADYGFGGYGVRSAVEGADAPPNAVFGSSTLSDASYLTRQPPHSLAKQIVEALEAAHTRHNNDQGGRR